MPCPAIDILVPMEAVLLIYGQRQKFDLLDILADGSPVTCFVCKPKSAEAEKQGVGIVSVEERRS